MSFLVRGTAVPGGASSFQARGMLDDTLTVKSPAQTGNLLSLQKYDATVFGYVKPNTGEVALQPIRVADTAYFYGVSIDGSSCLTGTTADKCYLLSLTGSRDAAYVATGDSNDALLKISGNNYAANDANFIFRPINVALGNRSGGTLGTMESAFGIQQKSGASCATIRGLMITIENYGTCSTEFGGVDISIRNEAAVATTEYALKLRNTNVSLATAITSAILITKSSVNLGFTNLFTLDTSCGCYTTHTDGYTPTNLKSYITVYVGGTTRYIPCYDTMTEI